MGLVEEDERGWDEAGDEVQETDAAGVRDEEKESESGSVMMEYFSEILD